MKQLLFMIAVVALLGCGKKGEPPEGDPPEVVVEYFNFDQGGEYDALTTEESADLIEAWIRKELKKPKGDLTKVDLEKVTKLPLGWNHFSDISALAGCKQLAWLDLSNNFPLSDISALAELKQLKYLSLENNKLTDASVLAELTKLEALNLNNNLFSGEHLKHLAGLKQLKTLWLKDNPELSKVEIGKLQKALPNCDIKHNAKK